MVQKKAVGIKDNRQTVRVPIQLLVDYRADGHYLFDFCRDLGTGGVFIETETPQAPGSTLELTFTIPDSKETLKVQAKIENRSDLQPGMGVQFAEFTAEQRQILEDFIRRHHGPNLKDESGQQHSA